ncbi:hypothetical protein DPX16_2200 [Anabarilius grahami]|uniref:Apolipoprotein L3 n=1 Tax=Anabarilius grahami TaxID=495550 RepID=A0A3N0Z6H4_ANAGA|nr:hypothetical protein DPX16_2200 [Anabarilius grahami]
MMGFSVFIIFALLQIRLLNAGGNPEDLSNIESTDSSNHHQRHARGLSLKKLFAGKDKDPILDPNTYLELVDSKTPPEDAVKVPIPALIMEAADLLCDSLLRWLENRRECAEKLLELAQELENVHQGSNIAKFVGAATSVASISGAVVATIFTGGLASPLLVAAATGTLAGTAVSITSPVVESSMSISTFKKATELIEKDAKVGMGIQKQLQDLKDRCRGTQLGDHADELECEVTTQLMCALARRDNTHVPLDFLRGFNRATFFRHLTSGGMDPDKASLFICQALCHRHVRLHRPPITAHSITRILITATCTSSLHSSPAP